MAAPSTPTNFYLQEGNGEAYLSWDLTATATSYQVQRSLDGVSFTLLASPVINNYLDTTVTVGTQYYYQIAATNIDGTSSYTSAQATVPTVPGQSTLGSLRLQAQQRADMVNSNFVTLPEWNKYINQSYYELYDLLITVYEDYYIAPRLTFVTDGLNYQYALPDGINYSKAPGLYKLYGVDLGLDTSANAFVTLKKFDFIQRNQYVFPQLTSTYLGVFNLRYRLTGGKIMFIPTPSAAQVVGLWYYPRLTTLLKDTDICETISGWDEYIITDAAIKAMQKEESDTSILMAQKQALLIRIQDSAMNRDAGQGDKISDTRDWSTRWGADPSGGNGSWGGW